MGYLICNQCEASYELEKGESADDFDLTCECGGPIQICGVSKRPKK
ncbi:MAG: hypothetical protein Q8M97_03045 [Methanobacteriaceae archaeon]|nr:hypothetical protein [Methanobacteriaceae archaeon]